MHNMLSLKEVYHGLSGKILLDKGRRMDFDLDIISLTKKGTEEVLVSSYY